VPLLFRGGVTIPTFGVNARTETGEWVVYCLGSCGFSLYRALDFGIFEVLFTGVDAPVLCAGCSLSSSSFVVKHVNYLPVMFDPGSTFQPWNQPFCDCDGGGGAREEDEREGGGNVVMPGWSSVRDFRETEGRQAVFIKQAQLTAGGEEQAIGDDVTRTVRRQPVRCPATLRVNFTAVGFPSAPVVSAATYASEGVANEQDTPQPVFGINSYVDVRLDLSNLGSTNQDIGSVTFLVAYPYTVWTQTFGFVAVDPGEGALLPVMETTLL